MTAGKPSLSRTAGWLFGLAKPYTKWVALAALSSLILVGFNILRANLVAHLVENALRGDVAALTKVMLILLPAAALAVLATWTSGYGAELLGVLSTRDLKNKVVNHIIRADLASVERYQAGDLFTRLNKDVTTVGRLPCPGEFRTRPF